MRKLFSWLFPKKRKSMDEFIDFVLFNECASIDVIAESSVLPLPGMPGVSMFVFSEREEIGTAYDVWCTAVAPSGEEVVCEYQRVLRWVSPRNYADDHEQNQLKMFLMAERCAAELDHRLATVNVKILGPSRVPMSKAIRDDIHCRAKKMGITTPPP